MFLDHAMAGVVPIPAAMETSWPQLRLVHKTLWCMEKESGMQRLQPVHTLPLVVAPSVALLQSPQPGVGRGLSRASARPALCRSDTRRRPACARTDGG